MILQKKNVALFLQSIMIHNNIKIFQKETIPVDINHLDSKALVELSESCTKSTNLLITKFKKKTKKHVINHLGKMI